MSRTVSALEPATKALVLGSLVLAVACESWLGRPEWASLPTFVALAACAGLIGGRLAPWTTSAGILFFTYLTPVILFRLIGRFSTDFFLIWSAAVTGLLVGDRDRWTWAYPSAWRFPLVLWAVAVAVAWPITALREVDFESLALLQRYSIPNTGIGGSPRIVIMWGMDTAIIHLLGLLWFNWLLRHATELSDAGFERRIAWPLAAGAIAGALFALYQGLFDLGFLSVGAWASIGRGAGSLLDGNASGMVAAMWSAGLLAFMPRSSGGRAAALAGAAVCWGGLWMSGSRTALTAASIALATAGLSALSQTGQARLRRCGLAVGSVAVVAVVVALLLSTSKGPAYRLKQTLPSEFSRAALGGFAREMWNRGGYGEAATVLIVQHPVTGLGMGLLNLSVAAHSRSTGGQLAPDNAQNWWRQHVAELGFLGSAGLLLWTVVFLVFLARTSGDGQRRVPAAALKGALVGLGLISLVGMPAQNLAVAMTFWAFAFWYTRLAAPAFRPSASDDLRAWQWAILLGAVGVYAGVMLVQARGDERPAMRAAVGKWRYSYGIYDPGTPPGAGEILRWTERHGVAVVSNDAPWMILTARAQHPDLGEQPVQARVEVNGRLVLDRTLHADVPITRAIHTGPADRAVIETWVDRTWRPAGVPPRHPDVGLALSWRFSAEKPAAVPAVTAPLRR